MRETWAVTMNIAWSFKRSYMTKILYVLLLVGQPFQVLTVKLLKMDILENVAANKYCSPEMRLLKFLKCQTNC